MRLVLACVGRLKAGAERDLVARYLERARAAGRALGFSAIDMIEIPESAARRPEDRMAEEGTTLLAACPSGVLIALDPRGKALTSEAFAATLAAERDQGVAAISLVIGGADGLSDEVRAKARLLIAYGAATFPHQLVRVMLAEQVYRAVTILSGHPYHRA